MRYVSEAQSPPSRSWTSPDRHIPGNGSAFVCLSLFSICLTSLAPNSLQVICWLNLPFDLHSNSMKYVLLTRILWPPDASFWLIGKHANAGKIEGRKGRGPQRMGWLNGITDAMDMNLGKLQEMVGDRDAWHTAIHGVMKSQTWLGYWTTMNNYHLLCLDERT